MSETKEAKTKRSLRPAPRPNYNGQWNYRAHLAQDGVKGFGIYKSCDYARIAVTLCCSWKEMNSRSEYSGNTIGFSGMMLYLDDKNAHKVSHLLYEGGEGYAMGAYGLRVSVRREGEVVILRAAGRGREFDLPLDERTAHWLADQLDARAVELVSKDNEMARNYHHRDMQSWYPWNKNFVAPNGWRKEYADPYLKLERPVTEEEREEAENACD